jgi:hypothetical protein
MLGQVTIASWHKTHLVFLPLFHSPYAQADRPRIHTNLIGHSFEEILHQPELETLLSPTVLRSSESCSRESLLPKDPAEEVVPVLDHLRHLRVEGQGSVVLLEGFFVEFQSRRT